jgi:spore coat protein A, manganese oxidase
MTEFTRKRFLQYGIGAGVAFAMPWTMPRRASAAMGGKLTKYVTQLPVPGNGIVVASPSGPNAYAFTQREISRQLHPQLAPTPLWAYDDGSGLGGQTGSLGMAIAARRGAALDVSYKHQLPTMYPAWLPVDTRLTPFGTEVRVMTHLHGGLVSGDSDGNPAATPNLYGPGQTQNAHYPNDQPASLGWFHDHGLGTTRLNVFAGLAGGYLIYDQFDTGDASNVNGLPSGAFEIPLVVQDRQFNTDGTFLYPRSTIPGVTWIGEYFGDVMLVNGMVWPYLNVEPRLYRFRLINGCNSRILDLNFGGAKMWQIGAEGGMFDTPVPVKALVMAPAERPDVLVDFSPLAGQTIVVKNTNPPKPVVTPAPALGQVMQIRVAAGTSVAPTIPTTLTGGRKADLPAPPAAKRRFITLNEVNVDTADWRLTLNGSGFMDPDPPTETPTVGTVEDWYYINLTGDTHPMHTHLVTFQVVARFPFNAAAYMAAAPSGPGGFGGIDPTPYYTGPMLPADSTERGFKDTVRANPGQVTIIRAQFDLPAGVTAPQKYVHHCHIVEHEDNDMMRTFVVTP